MVRTGTATTPIYERTIYIDGVFEYVILEDTSGTYEKNYIHIMDDKSRIAEVRIGTPFPNDIVDDITYTLENNIGSSVVRLDINGSVIDREEYYPFGDSSLRTFTYKRYRYVGKERDQESGLYYYGARYYAAWTCRFISVDPLAAQYPFYTPYNYAGNKPINKIDIDGMQEGNKNGGGTPNAAPTYGGASTPNAGGTNGLVSSTTSTGDNLLGATTNIGAVPQKAVLYNHVILDEVEVTTTDPKKDPNYKKPEVIYDYNSIDAPGAMDRLSDGAIVGQSAKKTYDQQTSAGMKASVMLYYFLGPMTIAAGAGAVAYKGAPLVLKREYIENYTPPPTTQIGEKEIPFKQSIPVNDGKTVNYNVKNPQGGQYGKLPGFTESGYEKHHMPADAVSGLSTYKGGAIQIEPGDHMLTASYGPYKSAKIYRSQQKALIDAGDLKVHLRWM